MADDELPKPGDVAVHHIPSGALSVFREDLLLLAQNVVCSFLAPHSCKRGKGLGSSCGRLRETIGVYPVEEGRTPMSGTRRQDIICMYTY